MNGIVAIIMEFNPFFVALCWPNLILNWVKELLHALPWLDLLRKAQRVGGGQGEEPAPLDSLPSLSS
jgi:hypothetical protein